MRRWGTGLGLIATVATYLALAGGSATAAGPKKLVEGTVYDTTCLEASTCEPPCPPPPHCGPVTAARARIVCAQQRIVACPLGTAAAVETSPPVCLPASGCFTYPVYSGEGAVVKVRKRGSATVLATLPVIEGHFKIRLTFGEYMLRPFLPEPQCWSGPKMAVWVSRTLQGPLSSSLHVSNSCVAQPDAAK